MFSHPMAVPITVALLFAGLVFLILNFNRIMRYLFRTEPSRRVNFNAEGRIAIPEKAGELFVGRIFSTDSSIIGAHIITGMIPAPPKKICFWALPKIGNSPVRFEFNRTDNVTVFNVYVED